MSTGVSRTWLCETSYLYFKGHIQGIKSIPISPNSGHCPTLRLHLTYLGKDNELLMLDHEQFKYLIKKFRKEIRERGYTEFVLEFSGFFIESHQEITRNLFGVYTRLRELFKKSEMWDWRRMDKRLKLDFTLYSWRR